MAEYYVNPNPGYVSPASNGPMTNMAPMSNMGPSAVSPLNVNAAPLPHHHYPKMMDTDAILVLFILLVIILRVCH